MGDVVHISSALPPKASLDYSALRESGMQWIRLWAKRSWTDHNVHDPGITMLEAASYAMTELGLRLDLDVADLLRSGQRRAPAELEPAHRVLPMGPVNARDLRRVLLDHPVVGDARVFEPAETEVAFYELANTNNPPLTFAPGTTRLRPRGLYEVLVELADRPLNSNIYKLTVNSGGQAYDLELALPFWDEPEAAPFRRPAVINSIAMVLTGGGWRALPEPQSHYARFTVNYTDDSGTPGSIEVWAVLRIAAPLAQPALVTPGILAEALNAIQSTTAGRPLLQFAQQVAKAASTVEQMRAYLSGWRNLGEQAVGIGLARVQDVAVNVTLEVTGGKDVEQLVAHILMDIDIELSPRVRFVSLDTRRATQPDPESIYDGPLLRRGFLSVESEAHVPPDVIYTSDVLRIIMRRRTDTGTDLVTQENPAGRDIVAVTDLTLGNYINNRAITVDAEDCLHLVEIERYRPRISIAKSRITVVRNDSRVNVDLSRVESLFAQFQKDADDSAVTDDPSPEWPVVTGAELPIDDFTPLQMELPALYGAGDAVLPESAGPERRAAAKQLKGYLFLFEQFLGDLTAQLGNVNRFYSGADGDLPSYFVRPPFDLPDAPALLRRFPANGNWPIFVTNPANPVTRALQDAAESVDRRLDRRNRMLDHLLARQGEDATALGQEIHRWARLELDVSGLTPAQQDVLLGTRRNAANTRLLRIKSALLRDTPELNACRLLANRNPFMRDARLLRIEPDGANFRWRLSIGGVEQLRAVDVQPSLAAAAIAAERALNYAGRATNCMVFDIGGGHRGLRVMHGTGSGAQVLGESVQSFGSVADANAALAPMAAAFASYRLQSSLSPLERRIAHHAGIRGATRRRSLVASSLFFEIFGVAAPPGFVGKRWRLRGPPAVTGPVILVSDGQFEQTTDPLATARAEASIQQVLRYGLDDWNYTIDEALGVFTLKLSTPAGAVIARAPASFASSADAEAARDTIVAHLYGTYGAETLYLVEHLLLRPHQAGDRFLGLPEGEGTRERDPYSQRVSLVFPSGRVRNFASVAAPDLAAPHRFRDPEFRRHVADVVQRACPAHLVPTIYWVDRHVGPGAPPASFGEFEDRYFKWLDTVLIPGAAPAAVDAARNNLVEALNAIADAAI